MASSSPPRVKRRRRAVLPLPSLHPDSLMASDAAELLAQVHLDRLIDRVRHAVPNLSETVKVCRRFRFDGMALPSHIRPDNCWWFIQGEEEDEVIYQCKPSRGPPRGVRRMCYTYEQVALGSIFQIDWQDITAASVLQIFDRWNHQSILRPSGLDILIAECSSRRRAPPSDGGSPLTLHIWGLPCLARDHVENVMEASRAWQLTYAPDGVAMLPPRRISNLDIVPMTEHEVQMLLRRPTLSDVLNVIQSLHMSGRWEEVKQMTRQVVTPVEEEQKSPEAELDNNFHDDGSVLSDVTPDASHMSDSAVPPSLLRR